MTSRVDSLKRPLSPNHFVTQISLVCLLLPNAGASRYSQDFGVRWIVMAGGTTMWQTMAFANSGTLAVHKLQAIDVMLLSILPLLIILSMFFSGSETALFGMSEMERLNIRRSGSISARAVDALQS